MFIGTNDVTIANNLKKTGYPQIKEFTVSGQTVFLFKNINKVNFSATDSKKVFYTNKMCF